jgi:hypothetical protein
MEPDRCSIIPGKSTNQTSCPIFWLDLKPRGMFHKSVASQASAIVTSSFGYCAVSEVMRDAHCRHNAIEVGR